MSEIKADLKNGIIEVSGVKYIREDLIPAAPTLETEDVAVHRVQANYYKTFASLSISVIGIPKIRIKPGHTLRISIV